MKDGLSKLREIADALRDRDLAELAKRQAHYAGAKLARADLIAQSTREANEAARHPDYRRDFELPRKAWMAERVDVLAVEEARAAADVETQKAVTSKSFGRAAVLARLAQKTR